MSISPNPAIISDHTVTDELLKDYKDGVYISHKVDSIIMNELKGILIIKNISTYLCQQTPLDRPHIRMKISHSCNFIQHLVKP